MLIALSPAKTLDFSPPPAELPATEPAQARPAAQIARLAKTLKPADLKRLMGISDALATLNRDRFKAWGRKTAEPGVQAALAFAGDVYLGLAARELDAEALAWAQNRIRILSGLYGVLRPLDRIEPYRLEMGIALPNAEGDDLYAFWRPRVAKALNAAARGHADKTLVNLASQEYFKAVDKKALRIPLVACLFKEAAAGGALRTVGFFAKRARGTMARFAVDERIEQAADLKAFDRDGYRFDPAASTEQDWTFTRPAR